MDQYSSDNDTVEESLNSQSEGFDISCRKVSSNFSTCSTITFEFASSLIDGSFRSTITEDHYGDEECKYEEEYEHWAHQCRLELDYGDDSSDLAPSPVDVEPPTPRTSNRKYIPPPTGLEITTAVTASLPTDERPKSPPIFFNQCDADDGSLETSSRISSVVDELDSVDEDDEFTYGTIRSDESIPMNDLLLETEEEPIQPSSLDAYHESCMTILKSNRKPGTSVAKNALFARDEEPVGDLEDDEPSVCSCDDSTLYEVASLDTFDTKREGEVERTVRKKNRTTLAVAHDDSDHSHSKQNRVDHDASESLEAFGNKIEGQWKDEMTVSTYEMTVSTYDVESLVEPRDAEPVGDVDESSECSCDDSTLYEVASLATLDTKREVGEIEPTERKTNRTSLAIVRDESDHSDNDEWESELEDFDDKTEGQWKDEMTASTCSMTLFESFSSLPTPTGNERPALSPEVLDDLPLAVVKHSMMR